MPGKADKKKNSPPGAGGKANQPKQTVLTRDNMPPPITRAIIHKPPTNPVLHSNSDSGGEEESTPRYTTAELEQMLRGEYSRAARSREGYTAWSEAQAKKEKDSATASRARRPTGQLSLPILFLKTLDFVLNLGAGVSMEQVVALFTVTARNLTLENVDYACINGLVYIAIQFIITGTKEHAGKDALKKFWGNLYDAARGKAGSKSMSMFLGGFISAGDRADIGAKDFIKALGDAAKELNMEAGVLNIIRTVCWPLIASHRLRHWAFIRVQRTYVKNMACTKKGKDYVMMFKEQAIADGLDYVESSEFFATTCPQIVVVALDVFNAQWGDGKDHSPGWSTIKGSTDIAAWGLMDANEVEENLPGWEEELLEMQSKQEARRAEVSTTHVMDALKSIESIKKFHLQRSVHWKGIFKNRVDALPDFIIDSDCFMSQVLKMAYVRTTNPGQIEEDLAADIIKRASADLAPFKLKGGGVTAAVIERVGKSALNYDDEMFKLTWEGVAGRLGSNEIVPMVVYGVVTGAEIIAGLRTNAMFVGKKMNNHGTGQQPAAGPTNPPPAASPGLLAPTAAP